MLLAPFDVWAAFANLVTPLAILLLFVGEYLLRYRLHPEFERATLAQAVRAYADRGCAMTDGGLVAAGDLDATFANVGGSTRSRRQYLADAAALAERLPTAGAMLNLSVDRYRFAVGLGAALLRGHTSLLPPNHVAETVARLRARFAGVYALVEGPGDDHGLPTVRHASEPARRAGDRLRSRRSIPTWSPPTC